VLLLCLTSIIQPVLRVTEAQHTGSPS